MLSVHEFDTSRRKGVCAFRYASMVLQVTFPCEAGNELWGLASMLPMEPKDRSNNTVTVKMSAT